MLSQYSQLGNDGTVNEEDNDHLLACDQDPVVLPASARGKKTTIYLYFSIALDLMVSLVLLGILGLF